MHSQGAGSFLFGTLLFQNEELSLVPLPPSRKSSCCDNEEPSPSLKRMNELGELVSFPHTYSFEVLLVARSEFESMHAWRRAQILSIQKTSQLRGSRPTLPWGWFATYQRWPMGFEQLSHVSIWDDLEQDKTHYGEQWSRQRHGSKMIKASKLAVVGIQRSHSYLRAGIERTNRR
ncbi:hypothetical protein VNO77_02461 [Canavalia gladiata]|uniref:Uncharacterized protein n=1 Tax=Canavalia gladiata TaxID=3824 RepID=A0AAN9R5Y9_CANGL